MKFDFDSLQPGDVASFATDAAPYERAVLDRLLLEVVKQSGSFQLMEDMAYAAKCYASEAADHAFLKGYALGFERGKDAERKKQREEEATERACGKC